MAGSKHEPDPPTFIEAINGEHGDEYREAVGIRNDFLSEDNQLEPDAQEPSS